MSWLSQAIQGFGNLTGSNRSNGLGAAGLTAAMPVVAKALPSIPGVGSVLGNIGGAVQGLPGVGTIEELINKLDDFPGGEQMSAILRGLRAKTGGAIGDLGSFLAQHSDTLLNAAAQIDAANQTRKARAIQDEALGYAKEGYAGREPYRAKALSMLNAAPPDLSRVYRPSGNPYETMTRPPGMAGAAPGGPVARALPLPSSLVPQPTGPGPQVPPAAFTPRAPTFTPLPMARPLPGQPSRLSTRFA